MSSSMMSTKSSRATSSTGSQSSGSESWTSASTQKPALTSQGRILERRHLEEREKREEREESGTGMARAKSPSLFWLQLPFQPGKGPQRHRFGRGIAGRWHTGPGRPNAAFDGRAGRPK